MRSRKRIGPAFPRRLLRVLTLVAVLALVVVPDANAAAAEALRRWSLQGSDAGERMRLGPPVGWHPERQVGLFNLFWG